MVILKQLVFSNNNGGDYIIKHHHTLLQHFKTHIKTRCGQLSNTYTQSTYFMRLN